MNTNKKINILQLVEGFGLGGAEMKLLELIKCMDPERFRTVVCSLGLGETISEEFEKLRNYGVEVVEIPRKHRIDPGLIYRLVKLIKSRRIDVIMTTLFYADIMGPIIGKAGKVKAVFSWETISSPEWLIPRRLISYRAAIRWCDKVISVSRATADFLIEKRGVHPDKIKIIPYGVNLEKYKDGSSNGVRKKLGLSEKDKIIGMVGRLRPQKGHVYLIDAAAEVVKKYPKVKFLLVGDGDLRSDLEKKVKQNRLIENFIFLGSRDDVPDLLKIMDIFTLPSLFEGLPNVILEAMASKKPIVATPVDGTKEAVINGETGILVPPKDPMSLSKALCDLLENPEKASNFGEKSRKRVEELFSLEKQVSSFENLYENYYNKNIRG